MVSSAWPPNIRSHHFQPHMRPTKPCSTGRQHGLRPSSPLPLATPRSTRTRRGRRHRVRLFFFPTLTSPLVAVSRIVRTLALTEGHLAEFPTHGLEHRTALLGVFKRCTLQPESFTRSRLKSLAASGKERRLHLHLNAEKPHAIDQVASPCSICGAICELVPKDCMVGRDMLQPQATPASELVHHPSVALTEKSVGQRPLLAIDGRNGTLAVC